MPHHNRFRFFACALPPTCLASALCWLIVASTSGCSLIFRSTAEQCSSDSDCSRRGASFAGYLCRQGTCVAAVTPTDDGGADGALEAETGQPEADGGQPATDAPSDLRQPDVDSPPDADAETSVFACRSNAECTPLDPTRPETVCDLATATCMQLTTEECPIVIGDYSGKSAAPILLGAFATLPVNSPKSHPSYLNYALAIKEFTLAGGIPGWDPNTRAAGLRMPVVVVCNAEANAHKAMTHLSGELHVPAVIAALDSVTLRTEFVNGAYPNHMFVVNPFGADSTLTSLTTDGLLWHMLGQPRDNASAYAAFLPRVETYVQSLQSLSGPMRIATVTGSATATQDLSAAALAVMQWNGTSLEENTRNGYFKNISIDSILSGNELGAIDVSAAAAALLDFKPNIVVSFGSSEFLKLLQVIELQWPGGTSPPPRPFYLLSPYNMESQDALTWIGAGTSAASDAKRMRLAGIGVASASDRHALTSYETRFLGEYLSGQYALGQENYYDAMYFAIYSIVGAGRLSSLSGADVAQGALRLLGGTSKDVGPPDMGAVFGALGAPNGTVSLFGTLGPPTFTRSTGARVGEGSVYCIAQDAVATLSYAYDVLRVAPSNDGGAPGLSGVFSCYSGL